MSLIIFWLLISCDMSDKDRKEKQCKEKERKEQIKAFKNYSV
jgi:hypothetical protein